jgi:hypothetical protein
MQYYIPSSLDIDLLLNQYPPDSINSFKKAKLLYILDLVTTIPANNKGLQLSNGFVPINAQLLQKKVRNYKQYLDYLVASNVFEVSKQYIPGEKSRGYKFCIQYATPVLIVTEGKQEKPGVNNSISKNMLSKQNQKKYQHLIKWFNDGLQIDKELAQQFILQDYQIKVAHKSKLSVKETKKDPLLQYNSSFVSIEKFAAGAKHFNIDSFGFRLHTILTNLRSELRNILIYNGLQLVSIDIKNSQPFMSTLLFNCSFWEFPSQPDVLTHNSIGLSTINIFNKYSTCIFIMLCKKANSCKESDVQKYREIVHNGTFYEYMAEHSNIDVANRKELKAAMFQMLFTDNRFLNQKEASPKRIFKELFPDVYKLFCLLKQKEKDNMPKLLQRIESHVILLTITKRIAKEHPELPIFTIHDSIVTTQGNEEYIQLVMLEEMTRIFGFPPQLTVSLWKPDNLKIDDGEANEQLQRAA